MLTEDLTEEERWNNYYDIVQGRPPRDTLLKAISNFETEKSKLLTFAIDLGCGIGNDSIELLNRGWSVLAIDQQPIALTRLSQRVSNEMELDSNTIETKVSSFENIELPKTALLNASYSIPFCHPKQFENLWKIISDSIQVGGRFAGHFFGKNDEWAGDDSMTFLDRNRVEALFTSFQIELFDEKDEMGNVANGDPKHWHLFSVVAKKIV